ncbi:RNA pyrophosphohydrolase [Wolbachia endosymbiont of Cruorifilaria tuberocauda]|uniref:RNA pyrophosphohydrolase n=1 Tax=Wolbachia endosymbiont of Cruorifilaria tuberocauda TaxID=1812111 RepID=UPI00158D0DD7|nr:RNA pyrophosphohydrolase [Wolbachia endosymbiont of Cruorifilaria tuberocauda]QKX01817.1 RNA pyrophosphohydrolase [Wolbachia endosymbiont of Cruorifilaria tuberocauda]
MVEQKDKYRSCVGIMLLNKQGHVFVGKRFNNDFYWQMPQGGVDNGEELEQAALRELLEEAGTDKVKVIAKSNDLVYYNLPTALIPTYWDGKYFGQKQRWFLMKFYGEDRDININHTNHSEFKDWCWQSVDNLVSNTIFFKKEVYKTVIEEFSFQIKTTIIIK